MQCQPGLLLTHCHLLFAVTATKLDDTKLKLCEANMIMRHGRPGVCSHCQNLAAQPASVQGCHLVQATHDDTQPVACCCPGDSLGRSHDPVKILHGAHLLIQQHVRRYMHALTCEGFHIYQNKPRVTLVLRILLMRCCLELALYRTWAGKLYTQAAGIYHNTLAISLSHIDCGAWHKCHQLLSHIDCDGAQYKVSPAVQLSSRHVSQSPGNVTTTCQF